MPQPAPTPDQAASLLLAAALAALDRDGECVAAAYVSMALAQVERRATSRIAR